MHSQLDYFNAIVGDYFANDRGLHLAVCSELDGKLIPHHCASIEEAQARIESFLKTHNIYVSLGMVKRPLGGQRGSEDEVGVLLGLVVDIDCQHPQRKKSGHYATVEEAAAALDSLPLKPSMVVATGHGIQVYWLWKEPWEIHDPEERSFAKSISQGWNLTVARTLKHTTDPTFALNHIYRVPGTINHKYEERPECEILELSERRYDPTEFETFCAQQGVALPITVKLAPISGKVPDRIDVLCRNSLDFKTTWNHKDADQSDSSQSGWDWRIANDLVDVGMSDQEIAEALLANRVLFDGKKKPQRYYERTISKIRANRETKQPQVQEEDTWYQRLSRMVGVKVKSIELEDPKHSVEDCVYWVNFSSGERTLVRKDSQIRSHAYWVKSLRGLSPLDQTPVPQFGKWEWESLMEKLRLHVVKLEQQSMAQQVINEIATYIDSTCVEVDEYNAIRRNDRRPLKYRSQYLFIQSDFLVWYAKLYGRIDKAALRSALDELQAKKRRLGPHAVEYTEILAQNLRAEAQREGAKNYPDGPAGTGGGDPQNQPGDGDQLGNSAEGYRAGGLPPAEPVH